MRHHSFSWRHRQHLLDRPALAAPAEQCLDPDARPLRPPDEGERLPVPREHVNAAVWHRGRRSLIAGRPGTRQVPGPVEPSPLGVPAQGQIGLSFQPAPELLVGVGPLVACGVPPRASLVGHIGPPPPRYQAPVGGRGPRGRSEIGSPCPGRGTKRTRPALPPSWRRSQPPGGGCPPARPGTYSQ